MLHGENFAEASVRIKRGYEYWKRKADDRPVPAWSDISPFEIKDLLPYVVVTQVFSNPLDFVERVTGEEVLIHSHRNSMGVLWSEYEGRGPDSLIWKSFAEVVERRQASFQSVPYVGPQKDFLTVEVITCPISDDGETVNKIISFVDYNSRSD